MQEADAVGLDSGVGTGDDGPGDGDPEPGTSTDGESSSGDTGTDSDTDTDTSSDSDGEPSSFRVVVFADPHVPSPTWAGDDPELAVARQRLLEVREKITAIDPAPDFAIVLGDLVHDAYGGSEAIWYQTNPNAFAELVEILDGFPIPVYPVFGPSDYDVPDSSKQLSHALFALFFARDPYYAVDHLGWRFVFANSQFGRSFDPLTVDYDPERGSFGAAQLDWIAEQLGGGQPTVLLSHFPLYQLAAAEAPNNGIHVDLDAVLGLAGDDLELVLAGHDHTWINLPATYAAPHVVFGSTMLDSDNFLLLEFATETSQYTILDAGKVNWGGPDAFTWTYDGQPMPAD